MAFLRHIIFAAAGSLRCVTPIALFGCLVSPAPAASAPSLREHQIKAAALYNVIAFTGWPATSFGAPDAPLVLGMFGEGPIASLLGDFVENESHHGRRIILKPVATLAEARSCHVLFVARSEHDRWRSISSQFARLPILTVSDAENFARQGGVVQFGIERNKLRLTVNLGVARGSGLTVSSKVLRLAEVLDDPTP